jgi:hypothetical protein
MSAKKSRMVTQKGGGAGLKSGFSAGNVPAGFSFGKTPVKTVGLYLGQGLIGRARSFGKANSNRRDRRGKETCKKVDMT